MTIDEKLKNVKIITEVEQGSEEWKALRFGKATASNFKNIITRGGKLSSSHDGYAMELAIEKFLSNLQEDIQTPAMRRGNELEPLAREVYCEKTLNCVEEVSFFDCEDFGYSPDGLVGDDGLIEIKCMNAQKHAECLLTQSIPDEHYAQCQGGLMISGRQWLDFISYHPDITDGLDISIIRISRDEDFINQLKEHLTITIDKRNSYISKLSSIGGTSEFTYSNNDIY